MSELEASLKEAEKQLKPPDPIAAPTPKATEALTSKKKIRLQVGILFCMFIATLATITVAVLAGSTLEHYNLTMYIFLLALYVAVLETSVKLLKAVKGEK